MLDSSRGSFPSCSLVENGPDQISLDPENILGSGVSGKPETSHLRLQE
jgi:hypothetical protein